ncbi:thiamine biosynthesis lipoprotein [Dyella sp. OK004]|uniref:FAD:protein FMN transferase n=1 Tax=Dyella sp. OK004 TaxID=1855292 RepID=UPI0008E7CAA4|nr:FAD:protein FMN transferase [Dyella sp. OK004]SFS05017.1 thiamine biosynthesis lipoprotein [Dyella sp. OK004]
MSAQHHATCFVQSLHGETMGTTWSARVAAPADVPLHHLQSGIQQCLDLVDGQMSTYKPHSALSRFNTAPAGTWRPLPQACFTVLTHALRLASDTGGAYDPTVGPLVNLWGFGPAARPESTPSDRAMTEARERVGWWKVKLDAANEMAYQPGGSYVDLSSVAKGYVVDLVGTWLDDAGVTSWLIEVGGELKGKGTKPDGSPWRIAIEHPDASGQHGRVVSLSGCAIATSGDYRRSYGRGGQTYSHHIDPRSGSPVPHTVASVSILAAQAMTADPLGTAMTVMGPEQGLAYARERHLAVLFVLHGEHGFEERMSPAFAEALCT